MDEKVARQRVWMGIVKVIKIALLVLLIIFFIRYLVYALGMLIFPYEWDLSEGLVLSYGQLLSKGIPIYKDTSIYPMAISLYPAFYPFVTGILIRFFKTTFFIPRLISFVSSLICGGLIYLIVKRKVNSRYLASIGSLFFFAHPALACWLPLVRVDTLALALAGVTLFILQDYDIKGYLSNRKKYLLLLILLLCIYTKQTFVFIVLVIFSYMFLKEKIKTLKFLFLFSIMALAVFFIFQKISAGWFFKHVVTFNANGFALSLFLKNLKEVVICLIPLWIIGGISLFRDIFRKNFGSADFYLLFSLAILIVLATPGIGINHFLGIFFALCILLGASLFETLNHPKPFLIYALLILQLLGFQFSPHHNFMRLPKKDSLKKLKEVDAYIRDLKGDIFLDLRLGFALKNNKEIFYFAIPYWLNYNAGIKHDHSILLEDIRKKRFSAIISTDYFWIPQVEKAIAQSYKLEALIPLESMEGWILHRLYLPQ